MQSLSLFPEDNNLDESRKKLGLAEISYIDVKSILTTPSGFINSFDYTLNPYGGCSFGCTYCYAASFAATPERKAGWGKWVDVKRNGLNNLKLLRTKPLIGRTIYISSVTDPYQPIEKELSLTREILIELLKYHKVKIVIQTRSSLIERDMDVIKGFGDSIQVNMTVTTDSERVRKVFEPYCPSNELRLATISKLNSAGIRSTITMTPLLPVENIGGFSQTLLNTGIINFVVQGFHESSKEYTASTPALVKALLKDLNWTTDSYTEAIDSFRYLLPNVSIGRNGFKPKFTL